MEHLTVSIMVHAVEADGALTLALEACGPRHGTGAQLCPVRGALQAGAGRTRAS